MVAAAMTSSLLRASLLLGVLLLRCSLLEACSPPMGDVPELTKAESSHYADSILVGKILQTYVDPRFDYGGGSDAYTALMKVYCIYKGPESQGLINITEVGHIPGMCHTTTLEVGKEYIVFLDEEKKIADMEIPNTEENRKNISMACDLHLRYPTGLTASDVSHTCPAPASEGSCVPRPTDPTITHPGHDHNKTHDHHHDHDHEGHDHEGHEGHDHDHDHEDHDHDHEGHDHEDHDHEGHDHKGHDHEDHDHEGHDHEGHDHDHDHEGHDRDHDHEGHDHEGHDHEGHDHEGHDHDHDHDHEEDRGPHDKGHHAPGHHEGDDHQQNLGGETHAVHGSGCAVIFPGLALLVSSIGLLFL